CRFRRSYELRRKRYRRQSFGRGLRRPRAQGRETQRFASAKIFKSRIFYQSQDRPGAPARRAGATARPRRRGDRMKRRECIFALGGAAAAWPLAAGAQQARKTYTIGRLTAGSFASVSALVEEFEDALREMGWIEGKNIAFEYRSADDRLE